MGGLRLLGWENDTDALGGVWMWLISEQSKAEPRLKIPFHPRSRPDFHKLPRPVCSDVCGWTPDAASPNSSTHHTDVHLVWSLGSENASLFFYIYYEERQKNTPNIWWLHKKMKIYELKKNAPVGEYMKKMFVMCPNCTIFNCHAHPKNAQRQLFFFFFFYARIPWEHRTHLTVCKPPSGGR